MKPLIVALDVETDKEAIALAKRLRSHVDLFKIGPVLFLKYGGRLIEELRQTGAEVFLDMKFHDIPSVVRKAIERAGEWGVYSATIHASGGGTMMSEAAAAKRRPKLWAVTVLTSFDQTDLKAVGVEQPLRDQVNALAMLAKVSGLDGVIASVQETAGIKKCCGPAFTVVTPGIRLEKAADDQKRTQTPADAIGEGSDFFVIGRPVTQAADPLATVQKIYKSIE